MYKELDMCKKDLYVTLTEKERENVTKMGEKIRAAIPGMLEDQFQADRIVDVASLTPDSYMPQAGQEPPKLQFAKGARLASSDEGLWANAVPFANFHLAGDLDVELRLNRVSREVLMSVRKGLSREVLRLTASRARALGSAIVGAAKEV